MGLCHSRPRSGAAAQAAATSIPTTEEHRQKNFAQTSPQQASAALSEPRSSPALSTPASPAAASQTNPPLGVDVAVLRELLTQAQSKSLLEPTTKAICDSIVVPATEARKCAYIELLVNRTHPVSQRPLVGQATVFISHAWLYDFEMVVKVLEEIATEDPNTYFWFDLVINNQHTKDVPRPFEWWCSTFQDSIKAIGKVVLILTPWNDPIPLTRAWCLWEIFSAATAEQVGFEVRLPETEKPKFKEAMAVDAQSVMNVLVRVQVERSVAYSQSDKDNIFNAIQATCGFLHLNKTVKDQLRQWMLLEAVAIAEAMKKSGAAEVEAARLYHNVASALRDFGDFDQALQLYEKSLAIKLATLGEKHPETATTYNNMALVYHDQGEYTKALALYEKSLAIKLATLGEKHPSTATTYNNMAAVYHDQRQYNRAVELYTKAHATFLSTLGGQHPNTIATAEAMARAKELL